MIPGRGVLKFFGDSPRGEKRLGILAALGAFLLWGILPLYWKWLDTVPLLTILSHRIFWSMITVATILLIKEGWGFARRILSQGKSLRPLLFSALLIGSNWTIYIYAVNSDQIVEASLGYYITPLVSMVLGVLVLRERLLPMQWVAVAMASAGSLFLAMQMGHLPWIALSLAFTFGLYGLIKKSIRMDSLSGLFVETLAWTPIAAGLHLWMQNSQPSPVGSSVSAVTFALLAGSGIITVAPLYLFAVGARRLKLTTLGFLQYVGPSCQLLLAVFLFQEPFSGRHLAAFTCIWLALFLYSSTIGRGGATGSEDEPKPA